MSLPTHFKIAKLRCRYALDVVEQKKAGMHGGFGPDGPFMEDVMADVSATTLRFGSKEELAQFLRTTPPRDNNQIYRMRDLDISGIDLSDGNFAGIEFLNCTLDHTNFSGSHLPRARIFDGSARNVDFTNANLIATAIADMDLTDSIIEGASVSSMHVNRCTNPPDFRKGKGGTRTQAYDSEHTGLRKLLSRIPGLRA